MGAGKTSALSWGHRAQERSAAGSDTPPRRIRRGYRRRRLERAPPFAASGGTGATEGRGDEMDPLQLLRSYSLNKQLGEVALEDDVVKFGSSYSFAR